MKTMVEVSTNRISSGQSEPAMSINKIDPVYKGSSFYMNKALTGFIIDAFDKIIIFIEGMANGPLQHVWNNVMSVPSSMGKILYNSDLIFENRLYPKFTQYGGLHIITLRVPLDMYLANPRAYIEGYIPLPCWKVNFYNHNLEQL